MARLFDNASNQYLGNSSAIVTDEPLTIAAFVYCDDLTVNSQTVLSVANNGTFGAWYLTMSKFGAVPLQAFKYDDSNNQGYADTTTGMTVNTWHHACAVFTSDTSRAAFIDGGSKGTDSTNIADPSADRTGIACVYKSSIAGYWSGRLAEVAVWNVALSDAEVAVLAKGWCPLFIQPQNIVGYWPLGRTDNDLFGGYNMTPSGSPTWADHPPILYPTALYVPFPEVAAGTTLSIAVTPTDSSYWVQGIKIVG
jgi:hypothetical protein